MIENKEEIILSSTMELSHIKYTMKTTAIIAHMYYEDLFEKCIDYLKRVPKNVDIYITTNTEEKKEKILYICKNIGINNFEIRVVNRKGREISALLIGCKDVFEKYKYLCFVHDKKTSGGLGPQKYGQTYMYLLWENMLKSTIYIENIIRYMEKENQVGLLVPPAPYHAEYFANYGNEWGTCYDKTKLLYDMLELKSDISEKEAPITIGTAFWCKTKALKKLYEFEFGYDLFEDEPLPIDNSLNHAIERILGYVAEHEGYITQIVTNEQFAALQLCNYKNMLNQIVAKKNEFFCFDTYEQLIGKEETN